jgi:outer membrane protein OmpA-like peptidoglycan-associated protein
MLTVISKKYVTLENNITVELEKEKALIEEKKELENKVKSLEGNLTIISSNIDKLKKKIAQLLQAIEDKDKKISELTIIFKKYVALENNMRAELEKEKVLAKKKVELENRVKSLEENLTNNVSKVENLKTTLSEKDREINELNIISKQHKELKEKLAIELEKEKSLTKEKIRLKSRVKLLETNLTSILNENDKLNNENKKLLEIVEVKEQKLQTLYSISEKYKLLEANFTKELEKEKDLKEKLNLELSNKNKLQQEKAEIEQKILELESIIKEKKESEAKNIAEINKLNSKKQELEELLSKRESELQVYKDREQRAIEEKKARETLKEAFAITDVKFERGSGYLTEESKVRLDKTAEVIKKYSNFNFKYAIHGHTDNQGQEKFNIRLSAKRAEKVKEHLILKGVPADILETKGVGSAEPIADNNTEEGRSKNRRVEFIILN